MKNPNVRTLRVESLIHNSLVLAELEVIREEGETLIVRTYGQNFKKLVKATDEKRGEFYHVIDIVDEKGEEWRN